MVGTFGTKVHTILGRARLILAVALGVGIVSTCDVHGITAPGTLVTIIVTPNTTLTTGSAQQMVAVGYDADGRVVSIRPTWSVVAGGGTINATGMFSAGNVTGVFANTVVASLGSISGQASITVIPGPLASITVVPSPVTLAVGRTQQFIAEGKDATGNIVQFTPSWSVVAGGGTISASGMFTAAGAAGTFTNTVEASNQGITAFATVIVTVGSPVAITVTPNPDTVIVGGKQQFVATGKDAGGNTVPLVPTWSVTAGGGAIDGSGNFTAGPAPGTFSNTINATSGTLSATATVVVTAGPLAAIKVTPNPATIPINGAQQFTAVGSDIAGNPVAIAPTWSVVANGGTINGTGLFTAGSVAGTFTNTIKATSGSLSGTATVVVAVNPLASITVSPNPSNLGIGGTQQFTAIGKDASGNVVAITPTWAVVASGGTISGAGLFTAGTVPGTYTNTVQATSGAISGAATVNVAAGVATQLAINAGNTQTAIAGTAVTIAPSVLVRDINNNPVSGVSVTFAVASGGGSATGVSATTNASGIATVGSWTLGPAVGANTLTATSAGLIGSPLTFTATAIAGAATQVAINAGNSQTATAGTAVATAPSVLVRDINNNPVSGVSVTFAVASGGGSVSAATPVTNSSGIATIGSWTLGATVGANTLTATSAGLAGSPLTFTATAIAGAATQIAINAGDNQSAITGTAVATAPSVLITDVHNNPVSGVSVTFAVASGGGSVSAATPVTNSSGIATIGSWTLGTTPGSNTLTATALGLTGSPLTFTATATVNLGTAAAFAVLGAGASSCVGTTNIAGNVGVYPAGTMSGFPTPCVISAPGDGTVHLNDATALQAQADVTAANTSLTGMPCTSTLTGTDLGTVGTLAPGVYCFASTAQLTGTLTLSGPANGLWVFKIGSTLTTAAGATITGTAPAANIFFVVGSDAPIGATNSLRGNIIAAASITLGTSTSLTGRALAKAAITMDTNNIVLP